MFSVRKGLFAALVSGVALASTPSFGETLQGALAKAYSNNASLNSARAGVRVTDEGVAIAKSGWRPTIGASGSLTYTDNEGVEIRSGSFGVQIQQSIFDGFQTLNTVYAAEARVRASNESLRNSEQDILFNAAAAYVDVLRDRQIAIFRERNLEFLGEQVRAANSRLEVGEGTRTDVAQARAQQAAAVAQLSAARAQVQASEAIYFQIVGDRPGKLDVAKAASHLVPKSLEQAQQIALAEHPAIRASEHLVDAAAYQVKTAEGGMLPQVSAQAGVSTSNQKTYGGLPGVGGRDGTSTAASVGLNLSIPIYQGGRTSATIRQAKEQLGQARIDVDVTRDRVRQAVTAAWAQYVAAVEMVNAGRELVSAAQLALQGVVEERNVGQRTTLDVLNAQADVISAQISLAQSERDVVAASYAILSAMGRLSPQRLSLNVAVYDPSEHYNAVKDKWYGTRTPDGR
ncbi:MULTISPECIES: TolC family outer membrane protein [unclassified Aminobacter]|uniref:TolC family outer membrane protein n=1 Tax=unclassified Aminobacter TaxID=2644704 RepID=UPI00046682C5|nr:MULTISPECIES: TolC family outer membrane protein [unclassified Aminobacter]TWG67517.1 outer membrane protein [Aminobacter sp. J44]TWH35619.1 outer membrane protein [Aminobacter sp. J15]